MLLAIAFLAVGWLLPAALLIAGFLRRAEAGAAAQPVEWRLAILSAVLCTLAFNLTFFLQELFLVIPKAFVPGLKPILYHNNHSWGGNAPIAELFEGTGALATLVSGLISKAVFDRARSQFVALFALWMTIEGAFQALSQFVIGAIIPANDVGRAYTYLGLSETSRSMLGLVALLAIPCAGIWIGRSLVLRLPPAARRSWRSRAILLVNLVGIPAIAAVPLIVPYREPRALIEAVILPLLVQLMGAGWLAAAAWFGRAADVEGASVDVKTARALMRPTPWTTIALACGLAVLLLAAFQIILRPGVRFY